jgi:hypothetical protein
MTEEEVEAYKNQVKRLIKMNDNGNNRNPLSEAKAANESGNGLLDDKKNGLAVKVEMKS